MDACQTTAVLIGQPLHCQRLERQLELLQHPPVVLGWIITTTHNTEDEAIQNSSSKSGGSAPILGTLDQLEILLLQRKPGLALLSFPAVMKDLIATTRTRLRKLGIADRFMPTLEDQIAGVGPRTHIDVDLAALLDRPPRAIDEEAVRSVICGKRVLITGAGGSIGSELSRIVANFHPEGLILIDRSENALFEIDRQIARRHPDLQRKALLHDVVDAPGTLTQFRNLQPQVIFHAAAHKHVPMMEDHPSAAVDNNLFGTISVADAAHEVKADRFVMISTDKAVNPSSIMGATKRLAEVYVQHMNRQSSTAFCMVRFGNVLGSSGSVLETWARQIADGGPVTVTDPRMTRYFMTIPEAAALVIQSAALGSRDHWGGEVFLLDMGQPVRIVDLARRYIELHGLEPQISELMDTAAQRNRRAPVAGVIGIIYTGIRPGEKLHEQLAFDEHAMRRTAHPDINLWELPAPDPGWVKRMVSQLDSSRRTRDMVALARQIRGFVPEFSGVLAA